jgi:hypothetical protein
MQVKQQNLLAILCDYVLHIDVSVESSEVFRYFFALLNFLDLIRNMHVHGMGVDHKKATEINF